MSNFNFIPYNPKLKNLAKKMRNNPTIAERIFWYEILRNKNCWGYNFLRQKPLLKYIVDFYCSKLLLAIELDGEKHLYNERYDQQRTKDLNEYGIMVVRYSNIEIIENLDGISEDLEIIIKQREKEVGKIPRTPFVKGGKKEKINY